MYGIPELQKNVVPLDKDNYPKIAINLEKIESIFATEDINELSNSEVQFLQDCRRDTTDGPVRLRRTQFLLSLLN
jgi:hypothetical protein